MNLKIGTIVKALLILAGLLLGSDVVNILDDAMIEKVSGAVSVLAAVTWDVFETFRLQKQGIVSTSPAANVAAPGSPQKLAKEEKKDA